MKKVSTILFSILLISNISLFADNANKEKTSEEVAESSLPVMGMISGRVIDSSTGEALSGVTVSLDGTSKVAFTDFDGKFHFQKADLRSAKLNASFISYQNITTTVNGTNSNEEIVLKLKTLF